MSSPLEKKDSRRERRVHAILGLAAFSVIYLFCVTGDLLSIDKLQTLTQPRDQDYFTDDSNISSIARPFSGKDRQISELATIDSSNISIGTSTRNYNVSNTDSFARPFSGKDRLKVERATINSSNISNDISIGNHNVSLQPKPNNDTIVIFVSLSGGMANHLGKAASGWGLALWLQQDFGIHPNQIRMVWKHQRESKWKKSEKHVKACFPIFRGLDFSEGYTKEWRQLELQQNAYRLDNLQGQSLGKLLNRVNQGRNEIRIRDTLSWFLQNLHSIRQGQPERSSGFALPYLHSDFIADMDAYVDRFYEEYRRLFAWDDDIPSCQCKAPESNETVIHFRNFVAEMPKRGLREGWGELPPDQLANELLAHLPKGHRVAFVTILPKHPIVQEYVHAMESIRGLKVRVVSHRTAAQDFCFLRKATHELIGFGRSTFLVWAGLLGFAQRVRIYSITSIYTSSRFHYNWTNPVLQQRFSFEMYHVRYSKKGSRQST